MHRHDYTYIDARTIRCDVCGAEKDINGGKISLIEWILLAFIIFGVSAGLGLLIMAEFGLGRLG